MKKGGRLCAAFLLFSAVTVVHLDHCVVAAPEPADLVFDLVYHVHFSHGEIMGNDQVEDQIGMGGAFHHTKIMHIQQG